MTFRLALYKGTRPGFAGVMNRIGRFLDGGPYSHVEIQFSNGMSASSTFEDGGVRFKQIGYSSGNWDFINLPPQLEADCHRWFIEHKGAKYDNLGNIRFMFGFIRNSPDKWFCSEAAAAALGLHNTFRYGPNGLADIIFDKWGLTV